MESPFSSGRWDVDEEGGEEDADVLCLLVRKRNGKMAVAFPSLQRSLDYRIVGDGIGCNLYGTMVPGEWSRPFIIAT